MTIAEWLCRGRARLGGNEDGLRDAEALLCAVTGQTTASLIAAAERPLPEREAEAFQSLLERRARGEPVAYLLGQKEFWSLTLTVTPDVLIPRPETELLVEAALAHAARHAVATLLELGTGSGAIALALASELPQCAIVATDISPAALEVAERNWQKLRHKRAPGAVEFCPGDWFQAVPGRRFDLIVANPPYIAPGDRHLRQGDVRFEPGAALVSPPNGLADLTRIITGARDFLNPGGLLLVEHGYDQASAVRGLFKQNRFVAIATHRDLAGNERVTGARDAHCGGETPHTPLCGAGKLLFPAPRAHPCAREPAGAGPKKLDSRYDEKYGRWRSLFFYRSGMTPREICAFVGMTPRTWQQLCRHSRALVSVAA